MARQIKETPARREPTTIIIPNGHTALKQFLMTYCYIHWLYSSQPSSEKSLLIVIKIEIHSGQDAENKTYNIPS